MFRISVILFAASVVLGGQNARAAASGKIVKVLPTLIDREGRHALAPSLYQRDAYQEHLRQSPQLRSGLRFDVQWKARETGALKLRVEMRGGHEQEQTTLVAEQPVKAPRLFRKWSTIEVRGKEYRNFGDLLAWRATLWDGDRIVAEQKSFLW